MSSTACPYCGESLTDTSMRFCLTCGRALTAESFKHATLKFPRKGHQHESVRVEMAKEDYTFHRQLRSFMSLMLAILGLATGYYFAVKYLLHEHMPGKLDVAIERFCMRATSNHRQGGQFCW
jgi:hypothetical protein